VRLDLFDYELPPERIAQRPAEERDGARLLVVREGAAPTPSAVRALPEIVPPGALVVVNDTRVIPARLYGRKRDTGGQVEFLLVEPLGPGNGDERPGSVERFRALARASKAMRVGTVVDLEGDEGLWAEVVSERGPDGVLEIALRCERDSVLAAVERTGHMPLPPYVTRPDEASDRDRYQTVYAKSPGAVAAPTAGLHLSPRLLTELDARGVELATVTLHVSLGTFQPVTVEDLDAHPMHSERFEVPEATASAITRARERGAPVVAIGTTVVRALESAVCREVPGTVEARSGTTRLLIQPGYDFGVVDALLTNFHLPRSTLLALVCAFGGHDRVLAAYRKAIELGMMFYSYGDAMWLEPEQSPRRPSRPR
jgi:S-adenosylmethionine:tRNA ribosyltransferase-isomerase